MPGPGYAFLGALERGNVLEALDNWERRRTVAARVAARRHAYDQFVRGLNSYRGAKLGHGRIAEAFELVRIGVIPNAGADEKS